MLSCPAVLQVLTLPAWNVPAAQNVQLLSAHVAE